MKKNTDFDPNEIELITFDDIEVFDEDDEEPFAEEGNRKEKPEPDNWTIVTALNRVAKKAFHSELNESLWSGTEKSRAFLREKLNLSDMQILFVAILTEEGESMSWNQMSRYLSCPRLELLSHTEEMDDLIKRRLMVISKERYGSRRGTAYELVDGVTEALSHNQPFEPEVLSGLSEQTLIERLQFEMKNALNRSMHTTGKETDNIHDLVNANPEIALCKEALNYDDELTRLTLIMTAIDYSAYGNSPDEGLPLDRLDMVMPNEWEYHSLRKSLMKGNNVLMKDGLIEHKCEDGIADSNCLVLTEKGKEKLLPNYSSDYSMSTAQSKPRNLKSHTTISPKKLFFNAKEKEQISRLANLLDVDNLMDVQERLAEKNMRQGFTCLFHGAPGTGKTETVYQLARVTGRDIMEVNIAGLRDKFVGESEKNIKAVFNRYRKACSQCDVMPILFFNEADAIINKRSENTERSVEKMDNAMQNIILQEMEDLDGILIATTNLTSNLDSAFDRRFLFKIEFKKPEPKVKAQIWNYMLEDITEEEAEHLASKYDFSGGQIENIARKQSIDYILSGEKTTLERLESFCREEILDKKGNRNAIGFRN